MVVSGDKRHARDYIEGLNMLASMRLCANTPGQLAIQTALGGYQSIKDLVAPGGRLCRQRDLRLQPAHADSGGQRGQAQGRAVHVSAPRPEDVPDRRRPAVRLRTAGRGEGADRAGHRLQLGRRPTISGWCSCPCPTIWRSPSAASPSSWALPQTLRNGLTFHETHPSRPAGLWHRRRRHLPGAGAQPGTRSAAAPAAASRSPVCRPRPGRAAPHRGRGRAGGGRPHGHRATTPRSTSSSS
jgi:hypothetical protein